MNVEEIAEVFEVWKQRHDDNPETFQDCEEFKADPPKTYGEAAARYYIMLVTELRALGDVGA